MPHTDARSVVETAASHLRQRLPGVPDVAVVLGTGLGHWADSLQNPTRIAYADIPGFPASTVQGHAGALVAGLCHGKRVAALAGRFHLYEGYEPWEVVFGVRALALLGVKTLVLTNAAGALNPQFDAGSLMLVTDHMNFTGHSPLRGPNTDAWGPRFPDLSRTYAPRLQALALQQAGALGIRLERGVYVQIMGPQLETPAETRAYRALGADAIGMSTVMEAIAARHMGLEILAISCLTNKNLPDCMAETTLEDVLRMAAASGAALGRLLDGVVAGL